MIQKIKMSHNIEAALLRCTSPGIGRPVTEAPFDVGLGGRTFRIATNGNVLLAADVGAASVMTPSFGDSPLLPEIGPVIERHIHSPKVWSSRESLRAWAGEDYRRACSKLAGKKDCEKCHSAGYVTCEYGHEHACPVCDGDGYIRETCAACVGTGMLNNDPAPIGIPALSVTVDAHLIGGMFDLLPGDPIGVAPGRTQRIGRTESVAFSGPGWMLIVVAMPGALDMPTLRNLTTTVEA